jgi:hypothetical protein
MGGKTEDWVLMGRVAYVGSPCRATLPMAWSLGRASMQIFILFLFLLETGIIRNILSICFATHTACRGKHGDAVR